MTKLPNRHNSQGLVRLTVPEGATYPGGRSCVIWRGSVQGGSIGGAAPSHLGGSGSWNLSGGMKLGWRSEGSSSGLHLTARPCVPMAPEHSPKTPPAGTKCLNTWPYGGQFTLEPQSLPSDLDNFFFLSPSFSFSITFTILKITLYWSSISSFLSL